MARAALNLSVRHVAAAAKVSPNTVTRLEAGQPVNNSTISAIRGAYEAAGAEFIEFDGRPGVRLKTDDGSISGAAGSGKRLA
jgi:transcriptional regulator with XRE-family HTH domain